MDASYLKGWPRVQDARAAGGRPESTGRQGRCSGVDRNRVTGGSVGSSYRLTDDKLSTALLHPVAKDYRIPCTLHGLETSCNYGNFLTIATSYSKRLIARRPMCGGALSIYPDRANPKGVVSQKCRFDELTVILTAFRWLKDSLRAPQSAAYFVTTSAYISCKLHIPTVQSAQGAVC